MILKQVRVDTFGDIITNTYIICDSGEAMIIDPGGEHNKINQVIEELGVNLKYIVLTHCHADHIGAVPEIKKLHGGKILISRIDNEGIKNPNINLGPYIGMKVPEIDVDETLEENDIIKVGSLEFKIIETPGHTKGGICLYCEKEKLLFSGDTLFAGTHGRTDLPTRKLCRYSSFN